MTMFSSETFHCLSGAGLHENNSWSHGKCNFKGRHTLPHVDAGGLQSLAVRNVHLLLFSACLCFFVLYSGNDQENYHLFSLRLTHNLTGRVCSQVGVKSSTSFTLDFITLYLDSNPSFTLLAHVQVQTHFNLECPTCSITAC